MTEAGDTRALIRRQQNQARSPYSRMQRRSHPRDRRIETLLVFAPRHRLLGDCVASALDAAGVEVERLEPSSHGVVQLPAAEPAAVLIDSAVLDDCRGTALVQDVHEIGAKVLIVATDPAPQHVSEYSGTGVDSVVAATAELRTLVAEVRRALDAADVERDRPGKSRESGVTSERVTSAPDRDLLASLSPREQAVLDSMMRGLSAVEIAETNFVALSTVRSQIRAILTKLDVRSQLAAVARAHDAGWNSASAQNHQI